MEKTLVFFKPDAIERGIVDDIIDNFIIKEGFVIKSIKPVIVTPDKILEHYHKNLLNHSKEIYYRVLEYFVNKMILILILEKSNAIKDMRMILGHSDPSKSGPHTIRGKYCNDSYDLAESENRSCKNIMHASDSIQAFEAEFKIWYS